MKRRPLGKSGVPVSVLGVGDVADRSVPLEKVKLKEIEARATQAIAGKGNCWWNPPANG